jgi:3-polyprenyl-4-hydroxybenzoate decarboxylase
MRPDTKDPELYGGSCISRMIIDATKIWGFGRRKEWNNDFYPPVNKISNEQRALVEKKWKKYGLE